MIGVEEPKHIERQCDNDNTDEMARSRYEQTLSHTRQDTDNGPEK